MIIHGDCIEKLREMTPESIDSMVTDPPAGISFMGKEWDTFSSEVKGHRACEPFVQSLMLVFKECLRVLKPGAHALVWAIPRTSHWTATALEDAGFEIRDVVTHLFGSGFPKSLDVSKAIDKAAGITEWKESIPNPAWRAGNGVNATTSTGWAKPQRPPKPVVETPEAKQWQGFGTALKPASEHWILCRKPLSEKTVAANVLKHGVGALNIDASRIGYSESENVDFSRVQDGNIYGSGEVYGKAEQKHTTPLFKQNGRFPANLVISHNDDCVEVGVKKVGSGEKKEARTERSDTAQQSWKNVSKGAGVAPDSYGTETVAAWECSEGCSVAELDRQSGKLAPRGKYRKDKVTEGEFGTFGGKHNNRDNDLSYGDTGGASRFFYVAKASKSERNAGCEELEHKKSDYRIGDEEGRNTIRERLHNSIPRANHHPTVKPIKLMTYLIRMITPPGGTVLDPFAGSFSTGVAAIKAEFGFIGIERELEYIEIGKMRMEHAERLLKEEKKE